MSRYRLKLDLQIFAKEEEEELEQHEIDGKPIDSEPPPIEPPKNVVVSKELDAEYWKKFLEIQKMQAEEVTASLSKLNGHFEALTAKLDDLDRRHQSVPASVRAEIENLLEAYKETGKAAESLDGPKEKKSKWKKR